MTLLEELTGKKLHIRHGLTGRKVVLALDEPTAEERAKVEEAARKAAKREALTGNPVADSRLLVLAALRDGRSRFEGDICEVAGLRHATVINALHRLRNKGEVEQTSVGRFRLWSITRRAPADDPDCIRAVLHVRSPTHTTGDA